MKQFEPLQNNLDLEILRVLWETGAPLTKSEIVRHSSTLNYSSVGIRLKKLLDSGVIRVADFVQTRTVIAKSYVPTLSYEEYVAKIIRRPEKTPSLKLDGLLSALCDDAGISEETIAELEAIIQRLKAIHLHMRPFPIK
ncbi:BlaI/MecI/CopY family transcriptional regulator [Oscillospiraceae bacterium OttesenSCG-928-F05]|nr:BlaI/MecI/CopY family transcriptional regulator [Oscillospiraceae bacterium OttesenSCG-928-F05]